MTVQILFILFAALPTAVVVLRVTLLTATAQPKEQWLSEYQYAHRGLHDSYCPENSLAAFHAAAQAGFGIEMDVQLSKDGIPVIFHDRSLFRMTGCPAKIDQLTFSELRHLRLNGTQQQIPSLTEVLLQINGRVPILFELKNNGFAGQLERVFYREIKNYGGKFAIQSFSPFSIRWFKKNAPHILRGQLACDLRYCFENISKLKRFLLNIPLYIFKQLETNFLGRPHFISYELHRIDFSLLKRLRRKGALIFAWTVRDAEQMNHARPYADSVIFEGFSPAP